MPVARDTSRPQIKLDSGVYGSLPWEAMPEPTELGGAQMLYWHQQNANGGQWVPVILTPGIGMDIDYDAETGILSITNTDYRVYSAFTADALIVVTTEDTATADSVLV